MNHNFVIQHFCTTFARRNSLQIYKKMIKLIIAISVLLLNIKVLLKKGARFSSQHIHDSEAMRKRGIHCVVDQDREARSQNRAY